MIALRALAFVAGLVVVGATLISSLKTVVLPRAVPTRLARWVFQSTRAVLRVRIGRNAPYRRRDRVMAYYGPIALLLLLVVWLTLIMAGYLLMFWAIDAHSLSHAYYLSGSSMLTLGFERPVGVGSTALVFSEAAVGLIELALLITYLPSLYAAFSRREALVASLEVRAGSPPTGAQMLIRFSILGRIERLSDEVWTRWELWFIDVEESHVSFPALPFFRSPTPERSWVGAAGAVLDAASLYASTLAVERDVQAEICIRAGYLALRRIAVFFRIPHADDPSPEDPISVTQDEYDEVFDRMAAAGCPMKADRDQAWRDFRGWRVNYDKVLVSLAVLTDAPEVPWSSDRVMGEYRHLVRQWRQERHRE